jgi:hypothetical protein
MANGTTPNSELVNYASSAFKRNYQLNGMVLYAFFAPEMYSEEDGLDCTGLYQIFLLHPTGQFIFKMHHCDGFWKIDGKKPYIKETLGNEMIQWLGDEIDSKTA